MGLFWHKKKKDNSTKKTVVEPKKKPIEKRPTAKETTKIKPVAKPATKTVKTIKAVSNETPSKNGKFIIRKAVSNYVFALQAANYENVATSGSGYKSLDAAKSGVESTKRFLNSPIQDLTLNNVEEVKKPKYEIYLDKAEKFRFRLRANNGKIIIVSDSYSSKSSCKNGIASIQKNAPFAEIEVLKS